MPHNPPLEAFFSMYVLYFCFFLGGGWVSFGLFKVHAVVVVVAAAARLYVDGVMMMMMMIDDYGS